MAVSLSASLPYVARGVSKTVTGLALAALVVVLTGASGLAAWSASTAWEAVIATTPITLCGSVGPLAGAARARPAEAAALLRQGLAVAVALAALLTAVAAAVSGADPLLALLLLAGAVSLPGIAGKEWLSGAAASGAGQAAAGVALWAGLAASAVGLWAVGIVGVGIGSVVTAAVFTAAVLGAVLRIGAHRTTPAPASWERLREHLTLGVGGAMVDTARSGLYAITLTLLGRWGSEEAVAAHTLLIKVSNVSYRVIGPVGMLLTAEVAAASAVGPAAVLAELRAGWRLLGAWTAGCALLFFLLPPEWVTGGEDGLVPLLRVGLLLVAVGQPAEASSVLVLSALRGLRQVRGIAVAEGVGAVAMLLASASALWLGYGLAGVWTAFILDAVLTSAVGGALIRASLREEPRLPITVAV